MKQKVLMIFAHPDDEVIFGWPILQNEQYDKELIICSSDLHNESRTNWSHRRYVLEALCEQLNINLYCFDFNSSFYRYPVHKQLKKYQPIALLKRFFDKKRLPWLHQLCEAILYEIGKREYDYIFTHNFWGECGHLDHIFINSLLFNNVYSPIMISNIHIQSSYMLPLSPAGPPLLEMLRGCLHSQHVLNMAFYSFCEYMYKNRRIWTWSKPPVTEANLYLIKNNALGQSP
jgi:hypothetical protein